MTAARWIVFLVYIRLLLGAGVTFKKSSHRPGSLPLLATMLVLISQSQNAPIFLPMAIPAGILMVASLVLFQWATNSIRGHVFSYIGDDDIPQFVFQGGPYAHIRHPFYTSYILTNVAVVMLFPNWISAGAALASIAVLTVASFYEEGKFTQSPCAEEYRAYAARTGRFLPGL